MKKIILFIKGAFMGLSDLIPGISGGTIALILGIYDKLIKNIKTASLVLKKPSYVKKIEWHFLIPIITGILFSIVAFSKLISYLISNNHSLLFMFFFSLIITTSTSLLERYKINKKNIWYAILGVITAVTFLIIPPIISINNWWYLFTAGFIAASAMLLPGISGSYMLVLLGLYDNIILALSDFQNNLTILITFGVGVLTGALTTSHIISYLLKNHKNNLMAFLIFLMLFSSIKLVQRALSTPNWPEIIIGLLAGALLGLCIQKIKQ